MVDARDANWANLRVWQDKNQDGISQTDELLTMDQAGIASIAVAKTEQYRVQSNGNVIADVGTYTRTDGTTGNTGTAAAMADVDLAVDTFHREFSDIIPTTETTESLPNMQGSGLVRDLGQAASLSTTAGSDLADLLAQYAAAETRAEQLALLGNLIMAWDANNESGNIQSIAA